MYWEASKARRGFFNHNGITTEKHQYLYYRLDKLYPAEKKYVIVYIQNLSCWTLS